jgi:hypothetical protein
VAEVVGAELQLEPVRGAAVRGGHHPGVVDEQVQRRHVGRQPGGEAGDAAQVGEVEHADVHPAARHPAQHMVGRLLTPPGVPAGHHHPGTGRGQRLARGQPDAGVGPGHHGRASRQVGQAGGVPGVGAHPAIIAKDAGRS